MKNIDNKQSAIRALQCRLGFLDQKIIVTKQQIQSGVKFLESLLNNYLTQRHEAEEELRLLNT